MQKNAGRVAAAALALSCLVPALGFGADAAAAAHPLKITGTAIGAMRIGMTEQQARRHFPGSTVDNDWGAKGCALIDSRDGDISGLITPSSRHRIVGVVVADTPARTSRGVGIGSSMAAVRHAYRDRRSVTLHPMDGVTVFAADTGRHWTGFVAEGRGVQKVQLGDKQFAELGADRPCGQ